MSSWAAMRINPRNASRAARQQSWLVSDTASAATDLALGDMEADVALGAIGVERYSGVIEHHQQLRLVGVQPREQAVERDEAVRRWKTRSKRARSSLRYGGVPWFGALPLEIMVEPPDQRAYALLRCAVQICEDAQLAPTGPGTKLSASPLRGSEGGIGSYHSIDQSGHGVDLCPTTTNQG